MENRKENPDQVILELEKELAQLRRSSRDLEQGEMFFQALFHASQTGIIIIHQTTGQIMDANARVTEILGWEIDEILGRQTRDLCQLSFEIQHMGINPVSIKNQPAMMTHKRGHEVPVIRSVTYLDTGSDGSVIFSFIDNSGQRKAETALKESHQQLKHALDELRMHKDKIVQSEKLASIGQLAAGVAHEINNPVGYVTSNLGTISDYADTMIGILNQFDALEKIPEDNHTARQELKQLIAQTKEDEDLEFIINDIENVMNESMEGVHRVAEIVQNLKSFAREDSSRRSSHDINEGIEAMIKVTWNELKYRCQVTKDLQNVPNVFGHGGQINQVIMNMMVNAAHAMPQTGGVLKLSTSYDGQWVRVSIADNGCGMDHETQKKIFDPFFTTKDVGKGTGLGLSISHGIIEEHGGNIVVESSPGNGTTFHLDLPPGSADEKSAEHPPEPEEELIG